MATPDHLTVAVTGPIVTVAVTGPIGTFDFSLMPLLQAGDRIARIVGIARRPFDPDEQGWNQADLREDVRDRGGDP